MDAKQYISFFGSKRKAISYLEKSIALYENSKLVQTPKTVKRIEDYKNLLAEIQSI
jgi:hypothetical protein